MDGTLAEYVIRTLRDARRRVVMDPTVDRDQEAETIAWQLSAPHLITLQDDPAELGERLAFIIWALVREDLLAVAAPGGRCGVAGP
jgi:hypothetical protein